MKKINDLKEVSGGVVTVNKLPNNINKTNGVNSGVNSTNPKTITKTNTSAKTVSSGTL